MIRLLTALIVFMVPSTVSAQEICGPQDYSSETQPNFECPSPGESEMVPDLHPPASVPTKVGVTITPLWDGALVHRDRMLELGLRIQGLRRLRWADRIHSAAEYDVELQYSRELCSTRVGLAESQRDAYQEQLQLSQERVAHEQSWYRSWWFGVVVGVIGTAAVVALTAYALSAVN